MSRAIRAMARLAKVRQDMAVARSKAIAAELGQIKALQQQVTQYANEYGDFALAVGQSQEGIPVSMLADTLAFRAKLLSGAKDQQVAVDKLGQQLQDANRRALLAKRKAEGFEKLAAKVRKEAFAKAQAAEWQGVEDRVGQAGTKDA